MTKNKGWHRARRWVLRSLFCLLLTAPAPSIADAKPRVVATIFPLADIVRQIAGDAVEVVTLLPVGASPHTFEPTPAQMRDIAGAVLVVRVGGGLDDWALKLLTAANPPPPIVAVTNGVELLHEAGSAEHGEHGGDPHVWLDPLLVRDQIVPPLLAALKTALPGQEGRLDQGGERFRDALSKLDAELTQTLGSATRRKFIAFHSAWRYFGRRYQLEQVAVIEEFPGKEPSARALAELIDAARHNGVRAMMVEPQFSARLATQVASEFGGTVANVDPIGGSNSPGRGNYLDLLRFNAKAFAEALRSDDPIR